MSNTSASPPPRPSALYYAPFCLLRPFTLRCTGKRGVADGKERSGRFPGRRRHDMRDAVPPCGTIGGAGAPEPARRAAPEGPAALIRVRRGGTPARWGGWGSWGDPGRAVVQICCKGAPGRDRPREEARNINDSLPALRRDPGLCNRFGQPAPPRAPGTRTRLTATTTGTPTTRRAPDDRTGSAGMSRPRSDDGDAILTVGRGSRERRPAREDARPRPARAPWAARRRAPTREIVT